LRARSLVEIEDVPMLTAQAEDSVGFLVTGLRDKGEAATAMREAGHRHSRHHEIHASPPRSEQATFPAILGVSPGRLLHFQPVLGGPSDVHAGLVLGDQPVVAALEDLGPGSILDRGRVRRRGAGGGQGDAGGIAGKRPSVNSPSSPPLVDRNKASVARCRAAHHPPECGQLPNFSVVDSRHASCRCAV
jgi:hypothetical protein